MVWDMGATLDEQSTEALLAMLEGVPKPPSPEDARLCMNIVRILRSKRKVPMDKLAPYL